MFLIVGAYDTLTFDAFMINYLVPQLWKGAGVVLDNGSIHKNKELREAIIGVKARLIFLPPYSPDL